ncbi:hypothetical protein ACFSUS_05470 [Spirosoma soli]|uniref:Lipoprotein n=1 Tax=Spirosoma soli TaxID=1770529 RepID=A0ABW5M1B0_9BACT
MRRFVRSYQLSLVSFILSSFLLAGCSSWNVDPKELSPIQVYTYDLVATSSSRWTVTFALGGNPISAPEISITDVGVCYSMTNQLPTTLSNDGLVAARRPVLPVSVSLVVTDKGVHYFRAYVELSNGTIIYSRTGSFIPQ